MSREPTDWTFGGAWPYAPKWFDMPEGRLQYIDEGPRDGIPIVMVHGNPTWLSRTGILACPSQIPSGPQGPISDFVAKEGTKPASAFVNKPIKIVWPMNDVAFGPETLDNMWLKSFPHADVSRIEKAGHFIQEDAHEAVISELMDFIDRVQPSSGEDE